MAKHAAHDLMPAKLAHDIPAFGDTGEQKDPMAWVKYFAPWTQWTWWVIEYGREDRLCYGFVNGHYPEFGSFSLRELEEVRGPWGLRIERDLYFSPDRISRIRERCRA